MMERTTPEQKRAKIREHNERNPTITVRLRTKEDKASLEERAEAASKTVNGYIVDALFGSTSGNTLGNTRAGCGSTSGNTSDVVKDLESDITFFFTLFQKNRPFKDISDVDMERLKSMLAKIKKGGK
jgi:hypothetical protein